MRDLGFEHWFSTSDDSVTRKASTSKQQRLLLADYCIVVSLFSWSSALHPLDFPLPHPLFSITLQYRVCFHQMSDLGKFEALYVQIASG